MNQSEVCDDIDNNCDLRRDVNKAFARVTGGKVNRGAG